MVNVFAFSLMIEEIETFFFQKSVLNALTSSTYKNNWISGHSQIRSIKTSNYLTKILFYGGMIQLQIPSHP